MKRLLILAALLSVPALAQANGPVEWSTYCDGNGVERVRCSITFELGDVYLADEDYAAIWVSNNQLCAEEDIWGYELNHVVEPLGGGNYRYTWEGFLRAGLLVEHPSFWGELSFFTQEPGEELILRLMHFYCGGFEQATFLDTADCVPLPVASKTWGAIKALYR